MILLSAKVVNSSQQVKVELGEEYEGEGMIMGHIISQRSQQVEERIGDEREHEGKGIR